MAETLLATFPNAQMAERAVGALLDHGASASCISLVADETFGRGGTPPDDALTDRGVVDDATHGITTTTGGDAAAGAMKGAGIGLGVGALAALASLIIPGFGLVIGGGALALALGAAAATTAAGAIAGGVTGYLIDQGVPDKVALTYQEELAAGRSLMHLSLPCGDLDRAQITMILDKYGAANIGTFPIGGALLEQAPVTQPLLEQPMAAADVDLSGTRQDAFVQHFEDNYRSRSFTFSEVAPAYEFGYIRAEDPRFGGQDWVAAESTLLSEWELLHPGSFDTMRMAVRYGWERGRSRLLA